MSVVSQLSLRGLARDPSAFAAAQAGALRQAANVVVRSEGVAESRPNFDLLLEKTPTNLRVRSLREFQGAVIAFEQDTGTSIWGARDVSADAAFAAFFDNVYQPVDYDASETKFAEARENLYATGSRGVLAFESAHPGIAPARLGGVMCPPFMTDYDAPALVNTAFPTHSHAYRFVLVRKDSNGYVRRSPPSQRFVCMTNWPLGVGNGTFASGTRVYLGKRCDVLMAAGDMIEAYRTRVTNGLEPRPEHFLAWTYTLTNTDIGNLYFAPPTDTTLDNDLGAQLYTDSSQGGAIAAKYSPPASGTLAFWQRCMWYGRALERSRVTIDLNRFFRAGAGIPRLFFKNASYTATSTTVQITDTSQLEVGMSWTDNLQYGPAETVLGLVYVPAGTVISSITDATHFVMSNPANATGVANSGVMSAKTPAGIVAERQNGTYAIGSPDVTGLTDTVSMRAGMYWTDNVFGPALVAGAKVPIGTKILSILGPNSVRLTHNALASGTVASYYGDVITIAGLDFYAWIEYGVGSGILTPAQPWTYDASNHFFNCIAIGSPFTGVSPRWLAAINLSIWLAHACNALGSATLSSHTTSVIGDYSLGPHGVYTGWAAGVFIPPGIATSVVVEELLPNTGVDLTTSCTCPAGIGPTNPIVPASTTVPNRLYFSDLDEPESVPLANYFDIGSKIDPVLALVPMRNGLLVFKTDGIWRVTGSGPAAWNVEPLDTTLRLLRPECVSAMNGVAYAWCDRGVFAVDENGAQSLSANTLDVELRPLADFILDVDDTATHAAFVVVWRQRNLVLIGVPESAEATKTTRVYALCTTTLAWSEWTQHWVTACESKTDTVHVARGADATVNYEVRTGVPPRGYDRSYPLDDAASPVNTLIVTATAIRTWEPVVGDFLSVVIGGPVYWRRILEIVIVGSLYQFTIDAVLPTGTPEGWFGYEAAQIALEWHPMTPARAPIGAMCREMHVHVDLRDGANKLPSDLAPRYQIGGSSERDAGPTTLTSTKPRVATVQPLRVGVSRQIARGASIAPYFATADSFPIRVLGLSLVHEGTSERTTR